MTEEKKEEPIKSKFEIVEEHPSFPKNEEQIILFWREIKAFETQLEKTKNCPVYTFYDGPPSPPVCPITVISSQGD